MRTDDLALQPGEWVEVRSAAEIVATLDSLGSLEGLPFMPEMLPLCGRRFRVYRRAHKTCDTIHWSGLRGMDRTVFLDMPRCDGSAHGGCQAGCLLFWKEAWLRRVAEPDAETSADHSATNSGSLAGLQEHTRAKDAPDHYRCQATDLTSATYPLSVFAPSQYVCDVRSNGATWGEVLRTIVLAGFNRLLRVLRRPTIPHVVGTITQTPHAELLLQPGELVQVKSHEEILATLDRQGKNRGLTFDAEMVPYCGQRFRVLRRVEKIIDEKSGELRSLPGVCIVLDHAVCRGLYHRLCPRSTYPYWREIWLQRVN